MGSPSAGRPQVSFRVVRADGGPEMSVPMSGETLTCGTRADLTLPDDPFDPGTEPLYKLDANIYQFFISAFF